MALLGSAIPLAERFKLLFNRNDDVDMESFDFFVLGCIGENEVCGVKFPDDCIAKLPSPPPRYGDPANNPLVPPICAISLEF